MEWREREDGEKGWRGEGGRVPMLMQSRTLGVDLSSETWVKVMPTHIFDIHCLNTTS